MNDLTKNVWPLKLRIRDTQLHDDIGGAGQRIYTTAGQGYEKREYVRADEIERLRARVETLEGVIDKALDEDYIPNEWLQEALAATEQGDSDEVRK